MVSEHFLLVFRISARAILINELVALVLIIIDYVADLSRENYREDICKVIRPLLRKLLQHSSVLVLNFKVYYSRSIF